MLQNQDTFNRLFNDYYPKVKSYTAAIVEPDVAEDITQDVFMYVWENRDKLLIREGFHSYLFQAAYTRCLDHFKKNNSGERYTSDIHKEHAEQYAKLLDENCKAIENLYTQDFYEHLYKLLEQIPQQRRDVFIHTYMEGLKTKEVADLLAISQRTVESHIYLTLKFLKKHMSKKDFFLLSLVLGIT